MNVTHKDVERKLKKKLFAKLEKDGRNFFWFMKNYLKGKSYGCVNQMLNGTANMQEFVIEAVDKYLGE